MRRKNRLSKNEFTDAILLNNDTYFDYLERLKKIALSLFEWENLPDSMSARWLELCLYYKGMAALLYDDKYGYINTQATGGGYLNIYGLPTKINCYSFEFNTDRDLYNPNSKAEKGEECILVLNNYQRVPTAPTLELFAYRLAQAERTADVNIQAIRTPVLILTDEKQKLSMKKLYEQYEGNTPVIFGDKNSMTPDAIRTLKTEAPFNALDIKEYQRLIWNEALTFLGINNLQEKKERLITDEADSNNELINLNMQSYLAPRQEAAKQFNQKFGLNVKVRVRSDLYNILKEKESIVDDYITKEKIDDRENDDTELEKLAKGVK